MKGLIDICRKTLYILNSRQLRRLLLLILASVAEALFELSGVVSVYPFIALILNPGLIHSNGILRFLYEASGVRTDEAFFAIAAIALILLYLVKNTVNAATSWLRYGFVFGTKAEVSSALMHDYMGEDYSFFLVHSSSSLMAKVSNDVSVFFDMVLQTLYFFSDGLLIAVFGAYLFYTDLLFSAVCFSVMLLFVLVFVKGNKRRATQYGRKSQEGAVRMTQWLQQAFGGSKEIKLLGREEYFVRNFGKHCKAAGRAMQRFSFLNQIPHMVLECVCTAAVLAVIIFKLMQGADAGRFVPTMAVFAMSLFRIFPRVSRLNQSLNTMIFSYPYLNSVYEDMKLSEAHRSARRPPEGEEPPLPFGSQIALQGICYAYPNTRKDVLSDINMVIKKGQAVGLVGASGAGKSTLADVILGILKPSGGRVMCDGRNIAEVPVGWSKKIGYIPQSIFLSEDTVRSNVAFGLDVGPEEDGKVWAALEQAQLSSFVRSLPKGLDTPVGERGVNFSGGQRQRIGIARALYGDPEILVLDEATSALDSETEQAVMDSIERLLGHKTMIIIAHRITTVKRCDAIYKVEGGGVRKVSYDELLAVAEKK